MSDKATGRPWKVDSFTAELAREKATPIRINGGRDLCTSVADVFAWRQTGDARQAYDDGQAGANARLIVRAVNNAEGLAEALRALLKDIEDAREGVPLSWAPATEALAKWDAEGGEDA